MNDFKHFIVDTNTRSKDMLENTVKEFLKNTKCEIISAQALVTGNTIHYLLLYDTFDE